MEKAVTFSVVVGTYSLGHWGITANPPPTHFHVCSAERLDGPKHLFGWVRLSFREFVASEWPNGHHVRTDKTHNNMHSFIL